jgi:hypothetical protein
MLSEVTIARSSSHGNGGAVALVGANASVYDSLFVDCIAAGSGGAAWVSSLILYPLPPLAAFLHLSNSTLQNNSATDLGGALTVTASSGGNIKNAVFTDNVGYSGGALAISSSSHTSVTSCHFSNNTATDSGGAVVITSKSEGTVERSFFAHNVADSGGGLAISSLSHASVTSCHFSKNTATDSGGAVVITSKSEGTVERSFFTHNMAESGGALAVTEQSSAVVQGSRFDENKALGLGGGAMIASASALELFANRFAGNEAPKGGGGALLWDVDVVPIVRMDCELGWFAGPVNALGRSCCVPCEPGFFKETLTAAQCTACGAGTYSNVTAATASSTCKACQAGKYQNQTGASTAEACTTCQAGSYSSVGSSTCSTCGAGTYSSVTAAAVSSTCKACQAGKYQNQTGVSSCKVCPEHSSSTAGSAACACDAGYYGDGVSSCEACPKHSSSLAGSTDPSSCFCDAGFYGDGVSSCEACTPGKYRFPTTVTCSGTCPCAESSGQYSGVFSDGPGEYTNEASCMWLIASTSEIRLSFSSFDTEEDYDFVTINRCASSSCNTVEQVAALSGSSVNSDALYTSSTGYLQVVFTSDESAFGSGFEAAWSVVATTGCALCPAGTYAEGSGASSCVSCPQNAGSLPGNSSVNDCNEGTPRHQDKNSASTRGDEGRLDTVENIRGGSRHAPAVFQKTKASALFSTSTRTHAAVVSHGPEPQAPKHSPLVPAAQTVHGLSPLQLHRTPQVRADTVTKVFSPSAGHELDKPDSQETRPPGRHLLVSSSIADPVAAAAPLSEHSHWLCGRGSVMPRADNNNAAYGPCVATTYKRLKLSGLPTTDSPGFAGVIMELVVLKQDAYNQTVKSDSTSSLQVFSAKDGERGVNDGSISFLGSIFSVLEEGRTLFSIAVKPTFNVSELEDRTCITALLRQPFLYIAGTDLATGATMQTDLLEVHLTTDNRPCRLGAVLVLDSNTLPTPGACVQYSPGACVQCPRGKYNVRALTGVCLACPPSAECFNGAPPLFGASKVAGVIELNRDAGEDAIKSAITAKVGVEFWQITVLSSQGQPRRSARSIQFELVADKTLMAALVQRIRGIGVSLGAIQAVGNLAAEGEVWVQVADRYLLKSCAPGSQLINTTDTQPGVLDVDEQKCRACGVTTYIIDQMHGCKKCPKGAGNPSNCQLCPCICF